MSVGTVFLILGLPIVATICVVIWAKYLKKEPKSNLHKALEDAHQRLGRVQNDGVAVNPTSNGLYEMKLNQNDLISYVIAKEIERLNNETATESKNLEAARKKVEELRKGIEEKVLELAKSKMSGFVQLVPADAVFSVSLDYIPHHRSGIYHGYGESYSSYHYNFNMGSDMLKSDKHNKNFIAHVKNETYGSIRINFTAAEIDPIYKEFNEAQAKVDEINLKLNSLQNERSMVRSNAEGVRNKLMEQHLSSTEEGKALLERLGTIRLSNGVKELA